MIIDGHTHIAGEADEGGFRTGHVTAEGLLDLMDGPFLIAGAERRVDQALVQPMISPTRTGDPVEHHRYVCEAVKRNPQRLMGCFVANPMLPLEPTLDALDSMARQHLIGAMKLHPTGHGYLPFKLVDRLTPLLEVARGLRLPVLVHQGDPPFGHPSQMAPLIESFPDVAFILCHFGTQRVVMADEAIYVARQNDNVYLETGWGALPRLKEGLAALGATRLIFGSDCPVQEIGSQLRNIEVMTWEPPLGANMSTKQFDEISGGNLTSLLPSDLIWQSA